MGTIAKIVLLLLCLLGFNADAQHRRWLIAPKPASGPVSLLPTGIAHHWIYTNITASPVSNWVDIVQGNILYQTTASAKPPLTANGLFFSDWNGEFLIATNFTFSFINGSNDFLVVVGAITNVSVDGTFVSGTSQSLLGHSANKWTGGQLEQFGTIVVNQFYDIAVGREYAGTNYQYYTNGVAAVSRTNVAQQFFLERVGRNNGGNYLDGFIKEIIHWTNVGAFTAAQVANIHKYATNTHGYAP